MYENRIFKRDAFIKVTRRRFLKKPSETRATTDETLDHFTPGGSWTPTYGWTGSNTLTSPAINANALRITNNTLQEGFKRNITLAAKKYTFSFFMNKGLEDLNDKEYFSVDIINSTNAIVYTYTTKVNATGYYNFDYTATTAGTYTWRFRRVSLNGRSTSGIAYFDDFKVSSTIQQSQQVCSSPKNYRFGFNTQEKDDEVYGAGNLNTAEFWEYDTRLGRRWNVDPVEFENVSPYVVNFDNPIFLFDPNGDSPKEGEKSNDKVEEEGKKLYDKYFGTDGTTVKSDNTKTDKIDETKVKSKFEFKKYEWVAKDLYDFVSTKVAIADLKVKSMSTRELSRVSYNIINKTKKYVKVVGSIRPSTLYRATPTVLKKAGVALTIGAAGFTINDMIKTQKLKASHVADLFMLYVGYKNAYLGLAYYGTDVYLKIAKKQSLSEKIDEAYNDQPGKDNDGVIK
jgi:hypothetical protein